ncbi:hypothetical protein DL768_008067 [Monosporascus sp. mg162]|nr:hypothetical protein DL768_008067 [Monosporascus sp. mg162]
MSDIYGRRQLLCVAWVLFSVFSAGCGLSKSMASLIVCRAFQGIGASGLYSLAQVVLFEVGPTYKPSPVLGGVISSQVSWRWIFWIKYVFSLSIAHSMVLKPSYSIPFGCVSLIILSCVWPRNIGIGQRLSPWDAIRKVDLLGNVMILCATTLVVFALQEAGAFAYTWNSPVIVLTLSIAGLSSVMFITWEVFLGFTYLSVLIIIPERFQIVNGENALWSGVHLLPMLGATAFGSFLAGAVSSKRNNTSITLIVSLCLQLIGTSLLSTLSDVTTEIKAQYGYQVILGLGIGLSLGAATILVSLQARHVDLAAAQGAIAQARVFGGAVGIAICSIILNTKIEDQLAGTMDPDEIEALHRSPTITSNLPQEQQQLVRRVYASAFTFDMILMIGVCAAGMICSLLTFERRPPPMPSAPGQTNKHEMASRGQSSETELDELVDVRVR